MSWIEILDNGVFLRSLFPQKDPALDSVRLHELRLHQDGPAISLRFDLSEFPACPPPKWAAANSNTVQVCLVGVGVLAFSVEGWTTNNVGRLTIENETRIQVRFEAEGCCVAATFDCLRVDGVTSYRREVSHE